MMKSLLSKRIFSISYHIKNLKKILTNSIFMFRSYLESQGKVGTEEDLLGLWDQFQFRAGEEVYKAWGSRPPLILWTSRLTEKGEVDKYLNKEDYIIQIWTGGKTGIIHKFCHIYVLAKGWECLLMILGQIFTIQNGVLLYNVETYRASMKEIWTDKFLLLSRLPSMSIVFDPPTRELDHNSSLL